MKENKIKVDGQEIKLENINHELEITTPKCLIHLSGVNKITNFTFPKNGIVIFDLLDASTLTFESLWKTENTEGTIEIHSHNQTKLEWNLYIEVEKSYNLTLENHILGSHNKSKIKVHVVTSNQGTCQIRSVGWIKKETVENEFLEELKGLTLKEDQITFLPDLIVDADSVVANHNATIKCLDEEELFYLQSKGILIEDAVELIKNGFLNKTGKN